MYPSERLHVVVADDGSPTLPDAPHVVTQPDEGFRAAAARNLGAREGNAPLILFLDGDTVPEPGFVAAMVTAWHEASADARGCGVVVTGRRRHAEFDDAGTVIRHLDDPAWLLDGHARTDDLRAAGPGDWRYVISAVLGMDRALFTRLGGFDEALVGYGGEDWDLGYRAWNAGAALRHAPVAVGCCTTGPTPPHAPTSRTSSNTNSWRSPRASPSRPSAAAAASGRSRVSSCDGTVGA